MSRRLNVEMNRVEGDLEIQVDVDDGVVADSWCVGTMYRGYEQVLVGRTPEDLLVIVPRICGICSTSQLYAGVTALEDAWSVRPAAQGVRVRNLCLAAESVMSDARHTFLMFTPDYCNRAYEVHPLYADAVDAFAPPLRGRLARETVLRTKGMLGVVTAFGGQWPHATYMAPGGVSCPVTEDRLDACERALREYATWYESEVLGCSLERWQEVTTAAAFEAWLDEAAAHQRAGLGLVARFGGMAGLRSTGLGSQSLLSAGCYRDPLRPDEPLTAGGLWEGGVVAPFDHLEVREHTAHSWFEDSAPAHPWRSATRPFRDRAGPRYSHAKASRYGGRVVQVGPLADLVLAGDPLMRSFLATEGSSTWLRQLARLHRPVQTMLLMRRTLAELRAYLGEPALLPVRDVPDDAIGFGAVNAARGTLAHWLVVRGGRIANYQIITPTTWNASPRDDLGRRGHWEESLVGLRLRDVDNPVELAHVVRSHDACLVCTTHLVRTGHSHAFDHRH